MIVMISPVVMTENSHFSLRQHQQRRFISLGQQKANKGITHVLYLSRDPIQSSFYTGQCCHVSGYLSYRLLFTSKSDLLVGVIFITPTHKTTCSDYQLYSGNTDDLPRNFSPILTLEKLEIVMCQASDSSVLVIPKEIESSLLVPLE